MRKALPNATFIGFTGTPIEKDDKSTYRTFGSLIDSYTISQAVQESFIYMGRNYSLQIIMDFKAFPPEAKLIRGKIYVYTFSKDERFVRLALENWYKDKAGEKIQERIKYYQSYFDIKPAKIIIKDQKKRWES